MSGTESGRATGEPASVSAPSVPDHSVRLAILAGAALFAAAALIPWVSGLNIHVAFTGREENGGWTGWGPLAATWAPRVGPGTVPAIALAIGVVLAGPAVTARLSWRGLVLLTWAYTWAWTVSLALVDGRTGIGEVFTRPGEYLYDATRVPSVADMLSGFVARISSDSPNHWQTHVSGHPAGALLTFVGLDRVGISDPFAVGLVVLTAGTTATIAALVAVRALAGEDWARRAAPFWATAPAALWLGVSADAVYTAVAAWGLASLALAATRPRVRAPYALLAGVLLGYCVYLSYGLVLLGILAIAVLLASRSYAPLPWAIGGALGVVAAFTAAGFLWWQAYPELVARYYDGIAAVRPYAYWVWADLAAATAATGLAVWAGLPAAARALRGRAPLRQPAAVSPAVTAGGRAVALIGSAAVLCMLVSTLSGMSKAEVERIWLPFTWWALLLPALLSHAQRRWLVALQVASTLLLVTFLRTAW